jgi:hypothetical protein
VPFQNFDLSRASLVRCGAMHGCRSAGQKIISGRIWTIVHCSI